MVRRQEAGFRNDHFALLSDHVRIPAAHGRLYDPLSFVFHGTMVYTTASVVSYDERP